MDRAVSETSTTSPGVERARWTLLVLTLISICSWVDRSILSILLEPMKAEFHASDTTMGLLTGFSFSLVYGVSAIPLAYLADRTSRRNVLAAALAVWSLMTAFCGIARTMSSLLVARMGLGASESVATPASQAMIADCYSPERRAFAISVFSSSIYLGTMLGAILGGFLGFRYGWRIALIAVGAPGLLLAFILYATVPEPVRGRLDWNADVRRLNLRQAFRGLAGRSTYTLTLLAMGVAAVVNGAMLAWAPAFLGRIHHLNLKELGLMIGLVKGVAGVTGVIGGGWLASRAAAGGVRGQLTLCASALALCLPPFVGFALAPGVGLCLVCLAVFQVFLTMPIGVGFAVVQAVSPPSARALAAAWASLLTQVVGGLGPLYIGALDDRLAPQHGAGAIRYAMVLLVPFIGAGALGYWIASRSGGGAPSRPPAASPR